MKFIYFFSILIFLNSSINAAELRKSKSMSDLQNLKDNKKLYAFELTGIKITDISSDQMKLLFDYLQSQLESTIAAKNAYQLGNKKERKKEYDQSRTASRKIFESLDDNLKKLVDCIMFHAIGSENISITITDYLIVFESVEK